MTKKKKDRPPFWFEDTFERMRTMEEQFHRMMAEMWKDPFEFSIKVPRIKVPMIRNIPVDIAETDKELIIRAELPGYEKDEISVKLSPNDLEIRAEKRSKKIEKGENFYRKETSYGSSYRRIPLPVEVVPEKSKAKFENGILEIVVKKAKEKKHKELKIE